MAHGTWKTTGGGADLPGLIQTVVLAGVAIGVALVIAEFAWLVISIGVAAVAARLYLLHRRNIAIAAIAAKGELMRAEQRALKAATLAERRRHEIEVARAGATVIQNIIDPAALITAAIAGAQQQPQAARVLRGEVER